MRPGAVSVGGRRLSGLDLANMGARRAARGRGTWRTSSRQAELAGDDDWGIDTAPPARCDCPADVFTELTRALRLRWVEPTGKGMGAFISRRILDAHPWEIESGEREMLRQECRAVLREFGSHEPTSLLDARELSQWWLQGALELAARKMSLQ